MLNFIDLRNLSLLKQRTLTPSEISIFIVFFKMGSKVCN